MNIDKIEESRLHSQDYDNFDRDPGKRLWIMIDDGLDYIII